MNTIVIHTLDYCYGVICKHCSKKVLDPDKEKKQKYLKDGCPSCGKDGDSPIDNNPKKSHITNVED